jgi:hypothetical protein
VDKRFLLQEVMLLLFRLTPSLVDSHLARRYPCIPSNEDVEMLGVPIIGQACRRFRISKLVEGADEGDMVVSGFHEREGPKSWDTVKEWLTFYHILLAYATTKESTSFMVSIMALPPFVAPT